MPTKIRAGQPDTYPFQRGDIVKENPQFPRKGVVIEVLDDDDPVMWRVEWPGGDVGVVRAADIVAC